MTSAADRGRRRARAATWTLVVGAAAGATAVAGVAAASTPTRTGTPNHAHSQGVNHRDSRGELGHEHAAGEHDGHRSGDEQTTTSPVRHQRHHRHHRTRLSPPTSSQPSATSSGS